MQSKMHFLLQPKECKMLETNAVYYFKVGIQISYRLHKIYIFLNKILRLFLNDITTENFTLVSTLFREKGATTVRNGRSEIFSIFFKFMLCHAVCRCT